MADAHSSDQQDVRSVKKTVQSKPQGDCAEPSAIVSEVPTATFIDVQTLPSTPDKFNAAYEQRRRALTAVLGLAGTNIELLLGGPSDAAGHQTTRAVLRSWAADGSQVHVAQLETPLGTVPEALVRGTDIVQATFSLQLPSA
eukprot:m.66756 g.66756  ORF g.66756 m.66756 type:complete len:142 (-) comp8383_c1_seq1:779-1204(-)